MFPSVGSFVKQGFQTCHVSSFCGGWNPHSCPSPSEAKILLDCRKIMRHFSNCLQRFKSQSRKNLLYYFPSIHKQVLLFFTVWTHMHMGIGLNARKCRLNFTKFIELTCVLWTIRIDLISFVVLCFGEVFVYLEKEMTWFRV